MLLWVNFVVAAMPMAVHAQSDPSIATLRGVHVVTLTVEQMPELAPFVDTAAIRLRVELKLREEGIEVRDTRTGAPTRATTRAGGRHGS